MLTIKIGMSLGESKEISNGFACLKSVEIREFYDLIGTSERNYAMAATPCADIYIIHVQKRRGDRGDNTRNFCAS